MVKVTPKTYRAICKLLKMMEEKGQELPNFSFEMESKEAVWFFSELLQIGLNNEVIFEVQHVKEKAKQEVPEEESKAMEHPKQKEKERKKSPTQDKIIEILSSGGVATIPQMMEKTQLSKNSVRSACIQLLKKGIIKKPKRGMYEIVNKSELEVQNQLEEPQKDSEERKYTNQSETEELNSNSEDSVKQEELQVQEEKKQEQINLSEAKCKGLFSNWKYYEVVEYIFTKSSFSVDKLRKSLLTKSNEIVEVIQLALSEGCIYETELEGRYMVEDIFRLYYLLLKLNRPVAYSKILSEFRGKPEQLTVLIRKCKEKGLITTSMIDNTRCYEVVK